MDTENKQIERSKILVAILATIGPGLVVAAAIRILGAEWPWLMLIAGVVIIMIAIFLAIPSTINLLSPIRVCKWINRTCIWLRRGPQWSISEPIISLDEITPSNPNLMQHNYTTTLSLVIKNRDNYPLEGSLYSLELNIVQRLGRSRVICFLRLNPAYKIQIQPHQEETYKLSLFGQCNGNHCLDIKKPYNWGIQGIFVSLSGAGYKELHRGLYSKPISQVSVGIV